MERCVDSQVRIDNDNRGVTLVEVIVSLMILMIVLLPLLSNFANAGRVNNTARDSVYASTVGENIMESVRLLGIEEMAKEFHDCGEMGFSLIKGSVSGSNPSSFTYYEVEATPDPSSGLSSKPLSVRTSGGNSIYVPPHNDSYVYRIDDVMEGAGVYDVELVVSELDKDKGGYSSNGYNYADFKVFGESNAALINPVIPQYGSVSLTTASPSVTTPPSTYDDVAVDYFSSQGKNDSGQIRKKINLDVKGGKNAEGDNIYTLNSELVYTYGNEPAGGAGTNVVNDENHRVCNGYCNGITYDKLNTVIIMYKPFHGANGSIIDLSRETIDVNIRDITNTTLNIYVVLQGDESVDYSAVNGMPASQPNINITADGSVSINVYSQVSFANESAYSARSNYVFYDNLYTDRAGGSRMYNVDVNVYEGGSNRLVESMKTTVLE